MKAHPPECQHCHKSFTPDPHNAWHQHFCYADECRDASKRHSQWKWLKKHVDAYCGDSHRMKDWRKEHPKSSRRKKPHREIYIMVATAANSSGKQSISVRIEDRNRGALQDFAFSKQPASTEITLVLTSALQGFVHVAPQKKYFPHRSQEKPDSKGGRKTLVRVQVPTVQGRKGRKPGWKLTKPMAAVKLTLLDWAHCLKELWVFIAKPCWEALAA